MNLEEKYFSTEGRLNRKPFIHYIIFLIVISLAFIGIITLLGLASALSIAILGENVNDLNVLSQIEVIPILLILVASLILIILFLPLNFLMIRRLHDLNFSGWWIIFPKWKLFIKKNRVEKTLYSKKYINLFEFALFN